MRLDQLKVGDLSELISKMPPTVQKSASIGQAMDAMLADSRPRLYVIDIEGNLVGLVNDRAIMNLISRRAGLKYNADKPFIGVVKEVLHEGVEQAILKPKPVKPSTTLTDAIIVMSENDLGEVPIVDDDYKLVGELVGLELLAASILIDGKKS
jgi:CBS domain-containing protein